MTFSVTFDLVLFWISIGTKQALADIHIMKLDSSYNKLD